MKNENDFLDILLKEDNIESRIRTAYERRYVTGCEIFGLKDEYILALNRLTTTNEKDAITIYNQFHVPDMIAFIDNVFRPAAIVQRDCQVFLIQEGLWDGGEFKEKLKQFFDSLTWIRGFGLSTEDIFLDGLYFSHRFHEYKIIQDMIFHLMNDFKDVPNELIEQISPNIKILNYKAFRPDARY